MLYKVPQKIDLEDKVIGPLTFRQFLYLLAGIVPAYIIAKVLETYAGLNIIIGVLLMFPLWLPALLLAFGKFQEQNLDQVIMSMLGFISMPKTLIWDKKYQPAKVLIKEPKKMHAVYSRPKTLESRLQNLSESLSIYGVKPEANSSRIVAPAAKSLVIKTKIKSVRAIPNQERTQLTDTDLKNMQTEFKQNQKPSAPGQATTPAQQSTVKSDIMAKDNQPKK
jgi:hypothetical protein